MTGSIQRIGRYRTSSGPDLAVVYYDDQLASFTSPASHAQQLILYSAGSWVGRNSGVPVSRIILLGVTSGRPGSPVAYTEEFSPSVGYTGAGGGKEVTVDLTTPYLTTPGYDYTVGLMNSHSSAILGVSMFQAQDISENNESFYRKDNFGTVPVEMGGATVTNEGQLVAWFNGELSVPPNTPAFHSRTGTTTRPTIRANFSDTNETLQNGVAWDYLVSHEHKVIWGGVQRWSDTYTATATERTGRYSSRQIGVTVPYDTTITYQVRHKDRAGLWSPWMTHTFSIPNPNSAPYAPDYLTPSTVHVGTLKPVLKFRHRDPDGNASNRAQVDVETAGGTQLWAPEFAASVANNNYISVTYNGTALSYHTQYRFRARTRDSHDVWGPWSGYVYFTIQHSNTAPKLPTGLSPSGTVAGTQAVTLKSTFDDVDRVLPNGQAWDYLDAFQIVTRRVSDNALMYDSGVLTPTATERSNRQTSRSYTIPTWDTDYRYYIRHRDRSGAWSAYASTIIRAGTGSSADAPSTPSGFITNLADPGVVASVYRNSAGLSMKAWQVGLFTEADTLSKSSPTWALVKTPGSAISTTWATTTFGSLSQGVKYGVAVRVQASNDQWSPWSERTPITANATPDTPIHYSPSHNIARSTLLPLVVTATDKDNQPLTVTIEALTPADVSIGTGTATRIAGTNRYQLVPSSIITSHQTFKWRSRSTDGFLTSAWSPTRTYIYAPVPDVAITSPGATINTATPTFTWTASAQNSWILNLYDVDNNIVYTASGTGSGKTHTISSSSGWVDNNRWNHLEELYGEVLVTASGVQGSSERLAVLLDYPLPPSLPAIAVETLALPGTWGTNYVKIHTEATSYDESQFLSVEWSRVEIDGPDGNEIAGTRIERLLSNTNSGDPTMTDFYLKSGQWYRWEWHQNIAQGVDVTPGEMAMAEAMVEWNGVILQLPYDPLSFSAHMLVGGPGKSYEIDGDWIADMSIIERLSGGAPVGVNPAGTRETADGTFGLVTRGQYTAKQQFNNLLRLWKAQFKRHSPDGRPHIVCWREGRGTDNSIIYGQLSMDSTRSTIGKTHEVKLGIVEVEFILGEEG